MKFAGRNVESRLRSCGVELEDLADEDLLPISRVDQATYQEFVQADPSLASSIDASLAEDQTFDPRRRRPAVA
jgi:hypothetical protein